MYGNGCRIAIMTPTKGRLKMVRLGLAMSVVVALLVGAPLTAAPLQSALLPGSAAPLRPELATAVSASPEPLTILRAIRSDQKGIEFAADPVTRPSQQIQKARSATTRLAQNWCSPASIEKFCGEYIKRTTRTCIAERYRCEARWKAACQDKHCCTNGCVEKP